MLFEKSKKFGPENFVKNNWRVFRLCVNAAQSHLFNEDLEMRLAEKETGVLEGEYTCGRNRFGFADVNTEGGEFTVVPLVGSECKLLNRYKEMLLKKYNLGNEDFAKLEMKGGWRTLHAPVLDLEVKDVETGQDGEKGLAAGAKRMPAAGESGTSNVPGNTVQISFRLQKGSYATVVIRGLLGDAISI